MWSLGKVVVRLGKVCEGLTEVPGKGVCVQVLCYVSVVEMCC